MNQAMPLAEQDNDKAAVASFFMHFGELLQGGVGNYEAWRLQYLTDLSKLPDYEEGYYRWYRGGSGRGAPVDENNKPLYYHVPKSWDKAANDGERWRFVLAQAVEYQSALANQTDMMLGNFFKSQYGVQTMQTWGWRAPADQGDKDKKTGTFALHTLKEDETIARLATGLQRFTVPDEFKLHRPRRVQLGQDLPARRHPQEGQLRRVRPRPAGPGVRGPPPVRQGRRGLEDGHHRVRQGPR
jgi:hypothetical protein